MDSCDHVSTVHHEDNPPPLLWYATDRSIRTTEIGSYLSKSIIEYFEIKHRIQSFSLYEDYIYWIEKTFNVSGVSTYKIMRAKQDGSNIETIISPDSLREPVSIAVDSETGDIYYGDYGSKTINVCANDGTNCRILYDVYVALPSTMVLHPQKRQLFWGNRDGLPMIVAASMNGTAAKPIIVKDISAPSGLDIDFSNDRLYWTDLYDQTISNCNADGTDRRNHSGIILGPVAVAILHDRVYYAKTHVKRIVSIDKITGGDEEPVAYDKVYTLQFPRRK